MIPRLSLIVGFAGAAAAAAACSDPGEPGGSAGMSAHGGHAGATVGQGGLGASGVAGGGLAGLDGGTTVPCPAEIAPDADLDGDGFSIDDGDCDDCDPRANPGAIDALVDGLDGVQDLDCDGQTPGFVACDEGLAIDDTDPMSAVRALDICKVAPAAPATKKERTWGALGARWVSASGLEPRDPAAQVGLHGSFGDSVGKRTGMRLLALSSGRARTPEQPDACDGPSCSTMSYVDPPEGFPQPVPSCEGGTIINDDVALEVDLRVPTNALGLRFAFKFHSFEWPEWVCTPYNDQFVALLSPAPAGSINGNVAFDQAKNPVSVNLGFFDVCDPATFPSFAQNCGAPFNTDCPSPPSPYCQSGAGQMAGTGFDIWGEAGATRWLETRAPVKGGAEIKVRFAIWDTTDQALDSTVLLDDFSWITSGSPKVSTDLIDDSH